MFLTDWALTVVPCILRYIAGFLIIWALNTQYTHVGALKHAIMQFSLLFILFRMTVWYLATQKYFVCWSRTNKLKRYVMHFI